MSLGASFDTLYAVVVLVLAWAFAVAIFRVLVKLADGECCPACGRTTHALPIKTIVNGVPIFDDPECPGRREA